MPPPRTEPTTGLDALLEILTGRGAGHGALELRHRMPAGMRSRFYPIDARDDLIANAQRLAPTTDVYIGCGLRRIYRGGRDAVGELWTLWADCDSPEARDAAVAFTPRPTLVIASGSPGAAHAYWALERPIDGQTAERANRRLAQALGADAASTDAARILRPPGTRNHKHRPATPVVALADTGTVHALCDVIAALRPSSPLSPPRSPRDASSDPLLAVTPRRYVPRLAGTSLGRDHKTACPLHEDRTPSLHAYPRPEQGWYCFGCRRGGSIYDLAAALWGLGTRGDDFLIVRRQLTQMFLHGRTARI